jgi:hypothetical protein
MRSYTPDPREANAVTVKNKEHVKILEIKGH